MPAALLDSKLRYVLISIHNTLQGKDVNNVIVLLIFVLFCYFI